MKRKILVFMAVMFWIMSAVVFIKLPNVSAGTGYDSIYGEDYYWSDGDVSYSSRYANGIFLSEGSNPGAAAWSLIISPPYPCSYQLEIGAYYTDISWFGDGPELLLYNWTTEEWDSITNPMPKGEDVNPRYSADIAHYASSGGYVFVEIYADGSDATEINYIEAIWEIDDVPPSNPNSYYSDHLLNTWSNDNTIYIEWSGAVDDRTSVSYSYEWSTSGTTIPDTVADTSTTSTTSSPPSDSSNWYFHVRSVDACGNWNSNAYHIGPFKIDSSPPGAPSPDDGVIGWSDDDTPIFSWSAPSDTSGIGGYSYSVDSQPDSTIDTTSTSVTLSKQSEGTHTFYVKAKDEAGNWGLTGLHQFKIDTTSPTLLILSPGEGSIFNSSSITVRWTGSDVISEINYYEIKLNGGSTIDKGTLTTHTYEIVDGSFTVKIRAYDMAGNSIEESVSFKIDTVDPSVQISNPANGSIITSSSITVSWSGLDVDSDVDHYLISLDKMDIVNVGLSTTHTFEDVSDGPHTIYIWAYDTAGNRKEESIEFTVNTNPLSPTGPYKGLPLYILILAVIIVVILILWFVVRKKKGKEKEPTLKEVIEKPSEPSPKEQTQEPPSQPESNKR
jgi:hypothetical protein